MTVCRSLLARANIVVVFLCLLAIAGCDLPSDASLIRQFQRSRQDFERLRQMADEDNIQGRIHSDFADPKLSDVRLTEYRRLMKGSGIVRLYASGRGKPLELIVDANGFLAQGDYKGFWYNPAESRPPAASLDESCFDIAEATKQERSCSAVLSLGEGWWLIRYEYR
jgi:hypothetical protein